LIRYCGLCGMSISLDERLFKVHYENDGADRYMCFCHRHDRKVIDKYMEERVVDSPYILYADDSEL